ncbi:MAG: DUF3768 domain-containing protein [Caulobacter sp.]|nr:DUF3768 domain-containing protein [Caulobacter sp.]
MGRSASAGGLQAPALSQGHGALRRSTPLTVEGARVLFKIDQYDRDLTCGSEDSADPQATPRIMTVLLAEEC